MNRQERIANIFYNGMYHGERHSTSPDITKAIKRHVENVNQLIQQGQEDKLTRCLFQRKGWRTYAVYYNNIHILETTSLKRAIDLFNSL